MIKCEETVWVTADDTAFGLALLKALAKERIDIIPAGTIMVCLITHKVEIIFQTLEDFRFEPLHSMLTRPLYYEPGSVIVKGGYFPLELCRFFELEIVDCQLQMSLNFMKHRK